MAEKQLSWDFDDPMAEALRILNKIEKGREDLPEVEKEVEEPSTDEKIEEPNGDESAKKALEFAEEELLKETTKLPEPGLYQCSHKVVFRACKKGYATYCNKCGKILSVRNRK